jgi:hypothetical protein
MNRTPVPARPDREIETIGRCGVEQGRERASEIRCADAGDMNRGEPILIVGVRQRTAERLQVPAQRARPPGMAGAVGPGHVKAIGTDTGEDVEHPACRFERRIGAGLSHAASRPCFDKDVATWA